MGADYIPEKDHEADGWMRNFATRLVEEPEVYRTAPGDAAQVLVAYEAFRVAYRPTTAPGFRSRALTHAKNAARKAAERLIRPAYQRVRTDPQIDTDAKVRIGVKLTAMRRRHVGPPEGVPRLFAKGDMSGRVRLVVTDSATGRKAKPREAAGFELFERVRSQALIAAMREQGIDADSPDALAAATVAVSIGRVPGDWRYVGTFTATPIIIAPAISEPGDEVMLVARWVNRRGEPGAFGQPVTTFPMFNPARDLSQAPGVQRRSAA